MKALKYAEIYDNDTRDNLPYKDNFGQLEKLQDGQMFLQDFQRLKAILFNNVSSCFFKYGNLDEAEKYNDMSVIQDPDYGKAHYRKCCILEKKGEFTQAVDLARYYIEEYENEFEMDEGNVDLVERFQEVVDRSVDKMGLEENTRRQKLVQEVEQQTQGLRKMEEMLDEEGFFVDDDDDDQEEEEEVVEQNQVINTYQELSEQIRREDVEREAKVNKDANQIDEENKGGHAEK